MSDKKNPIDETELNEWRDSFNDVVELSGQEQASRILHEIDIQAHRTGVQRTFNLNTPYCNTITADHQPTFPGSREIERRIKSIIRWNAMAMVTRGNMVLDGIGGHISSFASSATLYEIGFNHFFHGKTESHPGDLVYFQGHTSPGMYARAFVEGRLDEQKLTNFRRELAEGGGLSSYPHPWLMPDFWQFPTVSMGLGPISAIHQARFARYLENHGMVEPSNQKVWAFLGDGECDEPEALAPISHAGRENMDNLIFVVNCNLQRLDGPVRGNSSIVQELEARFRANGWNVIKVLWGSNWDELFEADEDGILVETLGNTVDGEFQRLSTASGATIRKDFFGRDPRLLKMVEHMSDEELGALKRGGHDPAKVYAAYKAATEHKGQPTCILAQTVKGYGLGEAGEGKNIAHNQKKLNTEELYEFRTRFGIPISDEDVAEAPFYRPPEDSPEMQYLRKRRAALGGSLPARSTEFPLMSAPNPKIFKPFEEGSGDKEVSTTMVLRDVLSGLFKDKNVGKNVCLIVPDEMRTFGMEGLIAQVGIYAHEGQKYTPVDKSAGLMYYKEKKDGRILQEGINEAGAMASFQAAATAYANYGVPIIPFYVYYSMFGFQRVGDSIWCAADSRSRGFLVGGTAGKTTLNGEGLQHEDGHSHVVALSVPNIKAYDPAYAYELAHIIQDGIQRMFVDNEECFYYITTENDNYCHPPMPEGAEVRDGIIKGAYRLKPALDGSETKLILFGSGALLNYAVKAQTVLAEKFGLASEVWSITSYKELYFDCLNKERHNFLHPDEDPQQTYIQECFPGDGYTFIATSDYMKILPDSLQRWMPGTLYGLGTDGFGRSESRPALRDHFEVDDRYVCFAALSELARAGKFDRKKLSKALATLKIDPNKLNPMTA